MKSCKYLFTGCVLAVFSTLLASNIQAQSTKLKKTLQIEDIELWRHHATALSNDGKWYTVNYSLSEKPEKNKSRDSLNIYGENAKTDVLYIYNAKEGLKYQIPRGSSPKFSSSSKWIAYSINSDSEAKNKKELKTVELRNLITGVTKQYKTNARFLFPEDKDFFLTSDKNSLLIYNLNNYREHYIGNIGEYLIAKDSKLIPYTIVSNDNRGNGIYLYDLEKQTTKAFVTGNYSYSDLSWNKDKSALVALRYKTEKKLSDHLDMSIITITGMKHSNPQIIEYALDSLNGMPEGMTLATNTRRIIWSNDNERIFLKIKKYDKEKNKDEKIAEKDSSTVSVWHWKDKKLLSQKMIEDERNRNKIYDAVVNLKTKKIIRLTSEELQSIKFSKGTDTWAIGGDNRKYISDWDVRKNDLYRINLFNGEKVLIKEEYAGRSILSPDGNKLILWDNGHYLHYDLNKMVMTNISKGLDVSFVNTENDHYGSVRDYGIAGWVKNQNAVLINHKFDLWVVPLDNKAAQNLTASITEKESIRFRLEDKSFRWEEKIKDRYIDLSSIMLKAFNLKTKYSGYYQLQKKQLKKLIFEPSSFSLQKAKDSDVVIYSKGSDSNYPDSYLSDVSFNRAKKITNTNPQQSDYIWGERILFDYTNDDGVELQGILNIPNTYKKGEKLPMIVYSYEKSSQNMYQYPSPNIGGTALCEMMYVSDGYLFMQPDIHFNVGTPHSDMHECIDAAIAKVVEMGYVDEARIGYEGFSYGGHCGMYISTQKNRFAAIAAGAGVSNLIQGFSIDIVTDGSNEQDYYMTGQGRLGTDPISDTKMFISESPVFNSAGMNTPLLLFHGTADNVVHWEHSFGFYSILRYLKKPVVFLSYQDEGHGLRKRSNRIDLQTRLKEYFDYYLKDKKAGKWVLEGLPYQSKVNSKDKKEERRKVPVWK